MSNTPETPPPAATPAPAPAATAEDRTVAIVSYITIIGFIIALIMHSSKKTSLGAYHLRQTLGLFLTGIVGSTVLAIIPVIGWMLLPFFTLAIIVLAVIGIIAAVNGQQKPLPLLGEHYQKWFAGAFT